MHGKYTKFNLLIVLFYLEPIARTGGTDAQGASTIHTFTFDAESKKYILEVQYIIPFNRFHALNISLIKKLDFISGQFLNGVFLEIKKTSLRQCRLPLVFCKFLVYIYKLSREHSGQGSAVGNRDRAVRQSTACQQRLGHSKF